ncbi:MAG: hypothetical protein IV100_33715 [Myxococcales bacterium]|nr:hypothetical protein [Myxococcales bacterium]
MRRIQLAVCSDEKLNGWLGKKFTIASGDGVMSGAAGVWVGLSNLGLG